jgi:hypothetical protein
VGLIEIKGQYQIRTNHPKIVLSIGIILVVSGAVLSVTGEPITTESPTPSPTPSPTQKITFTHPSDSEKVQMKDSIIGTAKNIPNGQQLWIAIYPHTALKYYPQKPVNIQNDGTWSLQVQFGEKDNAKEQFDIIAFLANESAQKELNEYINTSIKTKSWLGKDFLPDGVNIITQITVVRE